MKRGLFLLLTVLLTACQTEAPPQPLPPTLQVMNLCADHPLMRTLDHQHFFDQLPTNLGWLDHENPYYAEGGDWEVILIDLEAEDEHRTLVIIFNHHELIGATVIGYAPIDSCPEDEPERTETDGVVFVYDLTNGLRYLTYSFEGDQLALAQELPLDHGQSLDLLSHEGQRQCLRDYFQHKPHGLNCHILTELDILPRMQYVADDVSQILDCLQ